MERTKSNRKNSLDRNFDVNRYGVLHFPSAFIPISSCFFPSNSTMCVGVDWLREVEKSESGFCYVSFWLLLWDFWLCSEKKWCLWYGLIGIQFCYETQMKFRRNSSEIQFQLEMRELVETQIEIQMKIHFSSFEMHCPLKFYLLVVISFMNLLLWVLLVIGLQWFNYYSVHYACLLCRLLSVVVYNLHKS